MAVDPLIRIESIFVHTGHRDSGYNAKKHHFHDWYEIYIVTEGESIFQIYDKIYTAKKGNVILLKPGVFHFYRTETGCDYIVAEIAASYINRFFTAESSSLLLKCFDMQILKLDDNEVTECLKYIALSRMKCENTVTDKFLSMANLLNILSNKVNDGEEITSDYHKNSIDKLNSIAEYISTHYKDIHSISDITTNCFISKSYLFHLFNQKLGYSVSTYINNRRVDAACNLLRTTTMSVMDIAYECGFNSPQYFYKEFKARIACTPKEYIKQMEIEKEEV